MKSSLTFVLLIAGLTALPSSARAGDELRVAGAKIRLWGDQIMHGSGGLIYGGSPTLGGELVFFDAVGRELKGKCPVIVRTRSVGLTVAYGGELNSEITLGNLDGKTSRDLLGHYYGAGYRIEMVFGNAGLAARNEHGAVMLDSSFQWGLGAGLYVPMVTVFADQARSARYPDCHWDRRILANAEYSGEPGSAPAPTVSDEYVLVKVRRADMKSSNNPPVTQSVASGQTPAQ